MRTGLAALTILAGLTVAPLPHASASTHAAGTTCGLVTTDDPIGLGPNPGTQFGPMFAVVESTDFVSAGLVDLPDPAAIPTEVTVTCEIVGGQGTYRDFVNVRLTATGAQAAAPFAIIDFTAIPNDAVYVCTTISVTDARGTTKTQYFDAPSGHLMTDIDSAHCALMLWQETPPSTVCDFDAMLCPVSPQRSAVVVPTAFAET